ncbi:MAG TPA: hypothetical protein VN739_03505 [Nitrososphaerales archaeon]|nr:hypothetical protein [Nitrososphaerales archaeon]
MILNAAGYLSLALIFVAFGLIAILSMRSRTVSSFQFELYVFVLVVVMAEVPAIAINLGYLQPLQQYELDGLIVHSFSMAFLSGFVLWRAYKAFGPGTERKTKKEPTTDEKDVEVIKEKSERKN